MPTDGPRAWRDVAHGYDLGAAGYDARHGGDRASRARDRVLDGVLLAACAGAAAVLELGVGTGRLLGQVDAPRRVGLDVSAGMLAGARARGLAVVRGDAHRLPFADATFDVVLAGKGVFRYLDAAPALAEAARVLRHSGRLALHQYGARTWSPRGGARPPDPRVRELASVAELVAPAGRAGLHVTRVRRYRPIRVPPYLLTIPAWLDRASPAQLWGHVVIVLRRA